MNKPEYLLNKLMEECAEVIQIASKYKSFGPDSYNPNDPAKATNKTLLGKEIIDIMAVVSMIGNEGLLPITSGKEANDAIERKVAKVEFYMGASRECGCLEPEPIQPKPATD